MPSALTQCACRARQARPRWRTSRTHHRTSSARTEACHRRSRGAPDPPPWLARDASAAQPLRVGLGVAVGPSRSVKAACASLSGWVGKLCSVSDPPRPHLAGSDGRSIYAAQNAARASTWWRRRPTWGGCWRARDRAALPINKPRCSGYSFARFIEPGGAGAASPGQHAYFIEITHKRARDHSTTALSLTTAA